MVTRGGVRAAVIAAALGLIGAAPSAAIEGDRLQEPPAALPEAVVAGTDSVRWPTLDGTLRRGPQLALIPEMDVHRTLAAVEIPTARIPETNDETAAITSPVLSGIVTVIMAGIVGLVLVARRHFPPAPGSSH